MLFSSLLLLCNVAAMPAVADQPPTDWVGRIAAIDGAPTIRFNGDAWRPAEVNDPIAADAAVRTRPGQSSGGARAVLRIGDMTIALAPGSELAVGRLDSAAIQLILRGGRIGLHLRALDPAARVEIDVPQGGIWLSAPGDYDISAGDGHQAVRVAVFAGRADVVGGGIDASAATGSAIVLNGGAATYSDALSGDAFDVWRRGAAVDADAPEALRHVSPEITGYDALDAEGSWETIAGTGAVWFPNTLPDDWAPYRFGHWRWVGPWGWTWIDDMLWGFAPSHFGRWARFATAGLPDEIPDGERWGWVPGSRVEHQDYAPAVVAFLGTAGVGLSYPDAFGPAVAWFPLAPGEVYWPRYTSDRAVIDRLNQTDAVDRSALAPAPNGGPPAAVVNGGYRNRRFASVVPRSVFVAGRPAMPALLQLPTRRLDNAPLLAGSPGIAAPSASPATAAVAVARTGGRLALAAGPKMARAMRMRARLRAPLPLHHRLAAAGRPPAAQVAARASAHSHGRPRIAASATRRTGRLHLAAAHHR